MMENTLSYINSRAENDPEAFIAECDERYNNNVIKAADMICEHMSISPIVLLSGPSGSGKTTTAKKLELELESRGINSHTVSMDNYFRTLNLKTCPRTPEGEVDFESPLLLDMDLMNEHFHALSEGKMIRIPRYSFVYQKRSSTHFQRMQLKENEIVIFEGIHALNDMITDKNPEAFKLYISAATSITDIGEIFFKKEWIRLVRRVVRDNNFRGAEAGYTLELWGNVLLGEQKHITPFMGKADLVLDSTLFYEIPVLRNQALPLFWNMDKGIDRYEELWATMSALESFASIDQKYVPEDSLLREFIGGSIYSEDD